MWEPLSPDLDAPESFIGSLFKPISERLAQRFGHRTTTHSLVSLLIFSGLAALLFLLLSTFGLLAFGLSTVSFMLGYLSHLLADSLTQQGVPLYWPNTKPAYLLGKERSIVTGSRQEGLFLWGVLVLMVPMWWLSQHGLIGAIRFAMADVDQTYGQYRELSSSYEVFLVGSFQDNLTKARFEGSLKIVDLLQAGYVVENGEELLSVGKDEAHDLFPIRVRLKRGQPIREVALSVDLAGRHLGELLGFLDATKEHYIFGSLELEEGIEPPPTFRHYKPVSGEKTLKLELARWKDLEAFKEAKVKTGSLVVRHRLKEGEQLFFGGGHRAESEQAPPPIELEFEVSSMKEVFVKAGDRIEIGQLMALGPVSQELIRRRIELSRLEREAGRAQRRFELGLAEMSEYKSALLKLREAEADIAWLEAAREIRSPIAGEVVGLKVEGAGQRLKLKVSIRVYGVWESRRLFDSLDSQTL